MNILRKWFSKIFHSHDYKLICSKEIEGKFNWEECYAVTSSTAFSEGRSYYRDRKYEGVAVLAYFYCYECGDHHIELQYPGGVIAYNRNYLITLLYKNFSKEEIHKMLLEKRNEE